MTKESLDDYLDDFPLLIEAGFVAVKQLDEVSATRIFNAAQVLNPESTAPQVGLGYIALNKLEVKRATMIFESVISKEPENYLAQTFLGMCFLLTKPKRELGEKIIKEAIEKSDDPTIKNLGELSLEWAEKDLKKIKSPFFSDSPAEEKKEKKTEKEPSEEVK
ncbi:MAG: SctF chaperone SctG [Chlamydiota bacterium]|nr:SctF chaperone SctG [Chlamydiota bacterium]